MIMANLQQTKHKPIHSISFCLLKSMIFTSILYDFKQLLLQLLWQTVQNLGTIYTDFFILMRLQIENQKNKLNLFAEFNSNLLLLCYRFEILF